jgi:UDP-N-acetylmuramate dehydrogenase
MQLECDVPLAPLTTLRLGGRASRVAVVEREAEVPDALAEATRAGVPVFVLGGGSNVVVADEGVDALVLRLSLAELEVAVSDGVARTTLGAGVPWDAFVSTAADMGHSGVEALSGIPGLVGATPVQNVGAYGQEVGDTIVGVRAYDRETHAFVELGKDDCKFGYRTSLLKATGRYVVTAVTFALEVKDASAPVRYPELARALGIDVGAVAPLDRVREAVLALRASKGMVLDEADPESVSAGSFFVNPVVDDSGLSRIVDGAIGLGVVQEGREVPRHPAAGGGWKVPAAWLIERAGFCRGFTAGHVRVSRRHTLALVNDGEGTTRELLTLARGIVRRVGACFGVTLVPEPVMLGCRWSAPGSRLRADRRRFERAHAVCCPQ